MTKGYQIYVHAMSLLTLAGVFALWQLAERPVNAVGHDKNSDRIATREALFQEVADKLALHYDGEVDYEVLYQGGLKGLASALKDPYTQVYPPVEAQSSREELSGEFGGIGVTTFSIGDGTLQITSVIIKSPAEKAGIQSGDIIEAADGVSLRGMEQRAAVRMMRGKVGEPISLSIKRGEELKTVEILRDVIISPSVLGVEVIEGTTIGYLHIRDFTQRTVEQFNQGVKDLKALGMTGLVLDLRYNGGGSLPAATVIADAFIAEKDALITTVGAMSEAKRARIAEGKVSANDGGPQEYRTADELALVDVPCVVLVNSDTASASEVLAGALQDYSRAFILGTPTFGKGVVQMKMPLKTDPSYELKVTIGGYFTPLGNHLRHVNDGESGGIIPDLEYRLTAEEALLSSQKLNMLGSRITKNTDALVDKSLAAAAAFQDPQLAAAVKVLQGETVTLPLG